MATMIRLDFTPARFTLNPWAESKNPNHSVGQRCRQVVAGMELLILGLIHDCGFRCIMNIPWRKEIYSFDPFFHRIGTVLRRHVGELVTALAWLLLFGVMYKILIVDLRILAIGDKFYILQCLMAYTIESFFFIIPAAVFSGIIGIKVKRVNLWIALSSVLVVLTRIVAAYLFITCPGTGNATSDALVFAYSRTWVIISLGMGLFCWFMAVTTAWREIPRLSWQLRISLALIILWLAEMLAGTFIAPAVGMIYVNRQDPESGPGLAAAAAVNDIKFFQFYLRRHPKEILEFGEEAANACIYEASTDPAIIRLLLESGLPAGVRQAVYERFCQNFGAGFGESERRKEHDAERLEVIRLHLNQGIDVNAADADGVAPIMLSASRGWLEVMAVLIERGALVNAKDKHGRTPLMYLSARCWWRTDDVAELLIEHGAKINAKDHKGRTALMHAARYGRLEIIQLLVKHGADVSAMDNDGQRTADLLRRDLRQIHDVGSTQETRVARSDTDVYLDEDEMERILAFLEGRPIPPRKTLTFF
jgi:hypothetical protein